MPRVPFIGRLHFREYIALIGSFILVGLESFVRIVTLALPGPVIRFLYQQSRRIFNLLSSPQGRRSRNKKRAVSSPISKASDFTDLARLYGYYAEEHIVHTTDGYLLGVHRLGYRRGEEDQKVNAGEGSIQKKVVYLHHGLLMNSEVWVCLTEEERCLPFVLVEQGYDVWLGNNRGNKYSKKSTKFSPTSVDFWNFSIDQFAFHDIPDSINYILSTTKQKSLSYIGFSQGTAQAFATLSIHPNLNEKVDVFIALAPAMAPPGIASGIVSSFMKTSPDILFLLFGRKAILSSTTMWESLLYPALFCWFIDKSLDFLFNWKSKNMTAHQKLAAYPHLFSYTSTKSVVHWFQIIRNGTFQMYDDDIQKPIGVGSGSKYYKVAKFPTRNIKTPIVLVYGGSDSLVDINIMMRELPKHTEAIEVPHYEHLDFLWASDVHKQVFPHVMTALNFYASPTSKSAEAKLFRNTIVSPQLPSYSETERSTPKLPQLHTNTESGDEDIDSDSDIVERRRVFRAGHSPHPSIAALRGSSIPQNTGSPPQSSSSLTPSKPEGYWSSDEPGTANDDSPLRDKTPTPTSNFLLTPERDSQAQKAKRNSSKVSFDSSRSGSSVTSGAKLGFGIGVGKAAPVEAAVDRASGSGEHVHVEETKKRGRKK
ncbi:hypothetical protein B9Z65_4329 [Elsinoe australis]|uniref:AB hydrolase-1 domain-containing protein n=1 Tax=Elsinoe australis TaxID=40998 RepID=A0A2P7Z2H2_9PEZI|nr:hypothetical protein B9Z65_4329 [Elsinoe australis]